MVPNFISMDGEKHAAQRRTAMAGTPQWAPTPFLHIYAKLPVRLVRRDGSGR